MVLRIEQIKYTPTVRKMDSYVQYFSEFEPVQGVLRSIAQSFYVVAGRPMMSEVGEKTD